jgi:hypothetical protein
MALATVRRNCVSTPRRGSSEGASLTASVTALLRVPGGAEVRGFGVRERLTGTYRNGDLRCEFQRWVLISQT